MRSPARLLGLIGVGSIGRRVAQMASALGMRVIAVREHVEKGSPEGVETVYAPAELDELLRQSDYVVLAAPLTGATEGLINADSAGCDEVRCLLDQCGPRRTGG